MKIPSHKRFAPIIDLTSFAHLLEWSLAVDRSLSGGRVTLFQTRYTDIISWSLHLVSRWRIRVANPFRDRQNDRLLSALSGSC